MSPLQPQLPSPLADEMSFAHHPPPRKPKLKVKIPRYSAALSGSPSLFPPRGRGGIPSLLAGANGAPSTPPRHPLFGNPTRPLPQGYPPHSHGKLHADSHPGSLYPHPRLPPALAARVRAQPGARFVRPPHVALGMFPRPPHLARPPIDRIGLVGTLPTTTPSTGPTSTVGTGACCTPSSGSALTPRTPAVRLFVTPPEEEDDDITMHAEFKKWGDTLLVCSDEDGKHVGFRVKSAVLRNVCEVFSQLGQPEASHKLGGTSDRVYLDETAQDVHAFLRFLTAPANDMVLDLTQCLGVHRLLGRFGARHELHLALAGYLYQNAVHLVSALGQFPSRAQVVGLVGLAAQLRAAEVWHWLVVHIRAGWWRDILNPLTLCEDDIRTMSINAYRALVFIAVFGSGDGLWSEVNECAIGRDQNGMFFIVRSTAAGQQLTSDGTLLIAPSAGEPLPLNIQCD